MDPIAGLGATPAATSTVAQAGLGGLDGDAFMQLLVTQLRYQDPMAPSDTNGLLQQTSAARSARALTSAGAGRWCHSAPSGPGSAVASPAAA